MTIMQMYNSKGIGGNMNGKGIGGNMNGQHRHSDTHVRSVN